MKTIILLFFFIGSISLAWAHGDHDHDDHHGHHHGHDMKEELSKVYQKIFNELKIENNSEHLVTSVPAVEIKVGNSVVSLPESTLAALISAKLNLYEEVVKKNCECDTHEFHQENKKRVSNIVKKVITFLPEFGHILSDMLWTEVSGARRYGIIYVLVSGIGEIIDHNISPVPMCKFVAFLSRSISNKIKTAGNLLIPFYKGLPLGQRVKALYSRIIYRQKFRQQWRSLLVQSMNEDIMFSGSNAGIAQKLVNFVNRFELAEQGKRNFPASFSQSITPQNIFEEVPLALVQLDPMHRMWYIDRLIEYFNFSYLLILDQAKKVKRLKGIDKKNYFKLQWDIGSFGDKVDKLKILLYVTASIENEQSKEEYLNKIDSSMKYLFNEFSQYQILFNEIENYWSQGDQLRLISGSKSFQSVQYGICRKTMGFILNWKSIATAGAAFGAYEFMTDDGDVSVVY